MEKISNHHTDELSSAILEEAAIWQARLQDADPQTTVGARQWTTFEQWLQQDVRHQQAYQEMEFLWGALKLPVEQVVEQQLAVPAEVPVIQLQRSWRQPQISWRQRQSFKGLALAACLMLAIFASIGWQQDWALQWQSDHVTGTGEIAPVELEDNSRIILNTRSAVVVNYSDRERRIQLLRGEAWFDVSSADKRPFIVETDQGTVRVTGTQFNVRLTKDDAVVSLSEGRVALYDKQQTKPVILMPRQEAHLTRRGISAPAVFDSAVVTAWLRGQFVFYNAPLAEVIDTLNRYRQGHIIIADNALNALKVSGVFSTKDPDAALKVITQTLPINQVHLTNYLVLLH